MSGPAWYSVHAVKPSRLSLRKMWEFCGKHIETSWLISSKTSNKNGVHPYGQSSISSFRSVGQRFNSAHRLHLSIKFANDLIRHLHSSPLSLWGFCRSLFNLLSSVAQLFLRLATAVDPPARGQIQESRRPNLCGNSSVSSGGISSVDCARKCAWALRSRRCAAINARSVAQRCVVLDSIQFSL
jgi:hypothetical protein